MGEVKETMKRLNEALVKAGFPRVTVNVLTESGLGDGNWTLVTNAIVLRFDETGRFIKPQQSFNGRD